MTPWSCVNSRPVCVFSGRLRWHGCGFTAAAHSQIPNERCLNMDYSRRVLSPSSERLTSVYLVRGRVLWLICVCVLITRALMLCSEPSGTWLTPGTFFITCVCIHLLYIHTPLTVRWCCFLSINLFRESQQNIPPTCASVYSIDIPQRTCALIFFFPNISKSCSELCALFLKTDFYSFVESREGFVDANYFPNKIP